MEDKIQLYNQHEKRFFKEIFSLASFQKKRLDGVEAYRNFLTNFGHRSLALLEDFQAEIENNCHQLHGSEKTGYLKRVYLDLLNRIHISGDDSLDANSEGVSVMPYKEGNSYSSYCIPNAVIDRYNKVCLFRVMHMKEFVVNVLKSEGVTKGELASFINGDWPKNKQSSNSGIEQSLAFVTPYDYNDFRTIMPILKAKEFQHIESNLLQYKFIDENRTWKANLEILAAFIQDLEQRHYLNKRMSDKVSVRIKRAKNVFSERYKANLKNAGKASNIEDKLPTLIKELKFVFSIEN